MKKKGKGTSIGYCSITQIGVMLIQFNCQRRGVEMLTAYQLHTTLPSPEKSI